MRRLVTYAMAILMGSAPIGCSTSPLASSTETGATLPSFDGDDIRFFIETGASELLSVKPDDFARQESIPVELRGCVGNLPPMIFGKPTQRVADLSTVLDDDHPTTALRLVVLEQRDGDVKVRLSRIAMTSSASAEAWIRRANGNWRVAEVLDHWRNL
jgi:hypothetical protein